jgi:hypothetical protein
MAAYHNEIGTYSFRFPKNHSRWLTRRDNDVADRREKSRCVKGFAGKHLKNLFAHRLQQASNVGGL